MDEVDGSSGECQEVGQMVSGYLEVLIAGARTLDAREMLMDWKFMIEKSLQKDKEKR